MGPELGEHCRPTLRVMLRKPIGSAGPTEEAEACNCHAQGVFAGTLSKPTSFGIVGRYSCDVFLGCPCAAPLMHCCGICCVGAQHVTFNSLLPLLKAEPHGTLLPQNLTSVYHGFPCSFECGCHVCWAPAASCLGISCSGMQCVQRPACSLARHVNKHCTRR